MSMGDFSVDRWNTFVQQVGEALRVRRLGPLVFARCHWESDTPLEKLPPKLARLVETLAQWMQQPPERFYLTRKAELASVTLVVEFRPSATAIVSHARGFADLHVPTSAGVSAIPKRRNPKPFQASARWGWTFSYWAPRGRSTSIAPRMTGQAIRLSFPTSPRIIPSISNSHKFGHDRTDLLSVSAQVDGIYMHGLGGSKVGS
jgi:hypothetical protein